MTQPPRIPILLPLAVGAVVILCTFFIHALSVAMLATLVAHLLEIALWAEVFVLCGEFADFGTACYHSAVNYTTLGYGDIVMTPQWRFLGPLEAANGMILFGVTTAMIFALIQWLIQARFADLRE
jgi:hypothetical protein